MKYKSKIIYNKTVKARDALKNILNDFNLQRIDEETRRNLYKSIDELNTFIDNLLIY